MSIHFHQPSFEKNIFNIKRMCEELLTYIQTRQEPILDSLRRCDIDIAIHKDDTLDGLLDLAKKHINVFPYSDVKPCWFQLYANVCIAKAVHSLRNLDSDADFGRNRNDEIFGKVVASLDNALIIAGGGNEDTKDCIHEILRSLDHILYPHDGTHRDDSEAGNGHSGDDDDSEEEHVAPPTKKRRLNTTSNTALTVQLLPSNLAFVPKLNHPIPYLNTPSLTTFENHIHNSNTPLILKNTLSHWPALTKWHNANYWFRRTLRGHRLVPIELGQSYTDEDWRQEIMTFGRFLEEYVLKGDDAQEIGYLAQHDLFNQIPELRADFGVPDYCFADIPADNVLGIGGDSDMQEEQEGVLGLMKNGGCFVNKSLLTTTSIDRESAQIAPTTEPKSTSAEETRIRSPSYCSHRSTENHDHEQIQSDPSNHLNSDLDLKSHPDTSSLPQLSQSPTQSPSPPPAQIHQNIWFGTRTVTPLHHDPYSNILTQIHGTKYIRLYSPAYTALLYPRSAEEVAPHVNDQLDSSLSQEQYDGDSDSDSDQPSVNENDGETKSHPPVPESTPTPTIDMSNTSTIPLWSIEQSPFEDWDERYPGFSTVPYVEALLEAGDAVYIPKGWWHYVRGVSTVGIGISFWW